MGNPRAAGAISGSGSPGAEGRHARSGEVCADPYGADGTQDGRGTASAVRGKSCASASGVIPGGGKAGSQGHDSGSFEAGSKNNVPGGCQTDSHPPGAIGGARR